MDGLSVVYCAQTQIVSNFEPNYMNFKTMLPLIWNWMGSASEYLLFTYLIYIDCAAVLDCAAVCR